VLKLQSTKSAKEINEDSLKKKTAFSSCDVFQRSIPCPAGIVAMVFGGASNRSPKVRPHRTKMMKAD